MTPIAITFELNGAPVATTVASHLRLVDLLRDSLGQTGTKEGCSEGECGACTVMVDGMVVNSCLYPAAEIDGRSVTTIEGLARKFGIGPLSPLQRAFVEECGVQCGFCTPGMIMSAVALIARNADPSDSDVRDALTGNLCRCTGYVQIIEAIRSAAARVRALGSERDADREAASEAGR